MTDHLHPIDTVEDITPARLRAYAELLSYQGRESPAHVVGLCAELFERVIPYLTNRGICPMCGDRTFLYLINGGSKCRDCGWKP